MQHVEPEDLALAALGEPLGEDSHGHLVGCAECADELEALTVTVAAGRAATETLVPPPPGVWDRVHAELGLRPGLAPDGAAAVAVAPSEGELAAGALTVAVPQRRSRRRAPGGSRGRMPWLAAAAAAGLVVGGAGGTWLVGRDTSGGAAVLAQARLEPLPGWDASGEAWVEEFADGSRHLRVSLDGATTDTGFHEVWLIDRDVTRLVSMGILVGSSGEFTLPAGLDLDDFAVVDVSEEQFDGDPAHSGDSIIRGVLGA